MKEVVEFAPVERPLKYLVYDDIAFLSGLTRLRETLNESAREILGDLGEFLDEARSSWNDVVDVGCYLRRDQSLESLRELLANTIAVRTPVVETTLVDGPGLPEAFVEIEVTATRSPPVARR